jgi:protein-disulfide isomerase
MLKRLAAIVAAILTLACFSTPALAGSPHFVGTPTATISGDTVTVSGKEAGLGNETQIHVVVTADAACVNPGDQHPQAANKESFSADGTFPVQSGKADFTVTVIATFQPSCSPPMTVQWSNIVVTDVTNGISVTL